MSDLIESRISEIREDDAKFVAGVQAGVDAGAYTARGVIIGLLAVITRLRTASASLDPSSAPSETDGCTEDCEVDEAGYCKHAGPIVQPTRWWEAAGFYGPFTPTGEGGNDGYVRDAQGAVVADCHGWEARADVIAELLNRAAARSPDREAGSGTDDAGTCIVDGGSETLHCLTHGVSFERGGGDRIPETCRETTWRPPRASSHPVPSEGTPNGK